MISPNEMLENLMVMDRLNLGTVKEAQTELWCEVVNQAIPDVTAKQVYTALIRLAATRSTEQRGVFLTPADLIEAVRGVSAEERRESLARFEAAKHVHGDFTIDQAVSDPHEYLRFKQTAITAFMEGASVEQARAAAWAAIGRTPELEAPTNHYEINTDQIGKHS